MITALSDKLSTNYIPTPDEMRSLRSELIGLNQKTSYLEKQIQELRGTLHELEVESSGLDYKINAYRGMLSPTRHLLPEILQEIFVRCLPTSSIPVMSASEAPLCLARVCRQWRDLVYATPNLWAAIHIAVPAQDATHTCNHAIRTQAITDWLLRSGVRPLSISISQPSAFFQQSLPTDDTIRSYFEAISPFITRCRTLCFRGRLRWEHFPQRHQDSEFPLLRCISFDGGFGSNGDETMEELKKAAFLKAPELYQVSLIPCGPRAAELPLRWKQLTKLNLCEVREPWKTEHALSIQDALSLLSCCPDLIFCSLPLSNAGATHISNMADNAPSMVHMPTLTSFTIRCDIDPQGFLARLSAPSLRYFKYHQLPPSPQDNWRWDGDETFHVALAPFIQRVVRPVEELQLLATYLQPRDAIACLELFPGLKRLSLLGSGNMDTSYPPFHGAWDQVPNLSIGNGIIKCLIKGVAHSEDFDQESSDEESTTGSATQEPSARDSSDDEDQSEGASSLCPNLEAFFCSGTSFSDKLMLQFIRSRTSPRTSHEVSRLRWVNITFNGRKEDSRIRETLDNLQERNGVLILARYIPPWTPAGYDSPYSGLITGPAIYSSAFNENY
ncbi:hypothetical protein P691DRAFT_810611 [Macrolepiota fuliginosa MF-IS2]|uniref:F-box domain-containing protein n=1 Tax=Macrolepiota fuliginosa MF-IS2 TaxID=1400762 RepID=A0A9P5XJG0_9AGAR|nr:hypothetical protein P691DRAFT_810611 [Macrolepiota fuliginosa MF-IS2]